MTAPRLRFAKLLLATGAIVLTAAAMPTAAGALVYWGFEGGMGTANLDGTSAESPLKPGGFQKLDMNNPCGLAVTATHLYWVEAGNDGRIGRANLDGSGADESFIDGLSFPCGVTATSTHLYWADRYTGMIGRANLDGSGVERGFVVGGDWPCGVAVDGAHLYWANGRGESIGRADLDGTDVDQAFVQGAKGPCGVAVTASHVYWGSPPESYAGHGAIGRASIDGSGADNSFIPDVGEPWSLAANSTHLYWTDLGWRNFLNGGDPSVVLPGAVGRARLDGAEVNRRFIPTGLARGVALDTRALPGPPPGPSDYLRFGKLSRGSDGSVQLMILVPARGEFRVDSPAIRWSIDKGNPPPGFVGGFSWKLKLWPGKGTKAAKRIRRQLRRKGRAPIHLRMTYQQEGRLPLEAAKRFSFKRPAS